MRVLAQHAQSVVAESDAALTDLIDAHQAKLLAELDLYEEGSMPMVQVVQDCSGSHLVESLPSWVPRREHGKLSMSFDVQRIVGRPGDLYRAEVAMTLSDDREQGD